QLPVEIAERVHDHDALAGRVWLAAERAEPVDARRLQKAKVAPVVQVAHRVHVAPADRDVHLVHEFLGMWYFYFHGDLEMTESIPRIKLTGCSRPASSRPPGTFNCGGRKIQGLILIANDCANVFLHY